MSTDPCTECINGDCTITNYRRSEYECTCNSNYHGQNCDMGKMFAYYHRANYFYILTRIHCIKSEQTNKISDFQWNINIMI